MLAEILAHTRCQVERRKRELPAEKLAARYPGRGRPRSFFTALKQEGISLVAEFKRASPSAGLIRPEAEAATVARTYQRCGARAVSVLTEAKYFKGSLEDLAAARRSCRLPLLRKDFIIDAYQVAEAAAAGADALLLIVAALGKEQLAALLAAAAAAGLEALVEVHDEAELATALAAGARLIGINNRDLKTMRTDLATTFALLRKIPSSAREDLAVVSESGIKTREDLQRLAAAGVDGALIGEAFMSARDIAGKVRELVGGRGE